MIKFGVFVPAVGHKKNIEKYLKQGGVTYFTGLPVTDELGHDTGKVLLYDAEVKAKEFVQNKLLPLEISYLDVSYLDEFEVEGEFVGWEVEIYAYGD